MEVRVSGLNIYPVKSLGGISVRESIVTSRGLHLDRRWMVVDPEGNFLTQRRFPAMASLKVRVEKGNMVISRRDLGAFSVNADPDPRADSLRRVEVWGDAVDAVEEGAAAAEFMSDALGTKCRLVRMPEEAERKVNRRFGDHLVSFADGYPVLAASSSSLDLLNERLETPVPMARFRPNIEIEGLEPFDEDRWTKLKIGATRFLSAKPCARCVVTTIDQEEGRPDGKEPLRTLSRMRRAADVTPDDFELLGLGPNDALFGQNLIPLETGQVVRVGDAVELFYKD